MKSFSLATLALFTGAVVLHPAASDARPGVRGSAPTSISRPAGGGGNFQGGRANASGGGNFQGARANTGQRTNTSAQVNQGARASGNTQVSGGARTVNNSGNRTVNNTGARAVNTGNINTGNINTGNINTGNVNVRSGNTVNVNTNDGGWGYWNDHPVATGMAVGTAAAVTTAAIGSMMYSLPPACAPRPYGGMTYYYCGGAWYAPQYQGDQVVYVTVNAPQ